MINKYPLRMEKVYHARQYDPALGRFIQADTILPNPDDSRALDRYAYSIGNPVKFNDPSGHSVDCGLGDPDCRAGKLPAPVPVAQTPKGPTLASTPTLPLNPSGIYFGPYSPTATPQTVLRAGSTRTPTPTGTPTPLPPGEVAKQMGEEVADIFSPFRYDPGSATGTDVSSMILSGAQSISMSSPQLSWVYPVAQTVVGIGTGFGAIWDAAPAVEKWWSDANANMSTTATMLPINGPTVSPTTSHATSTPVPIPFPTYTPTFPPPHW